MHTRFKTVLCDDKTQIGGNCTLTYEQKKINVKQNSLCFNCLESHRVKKTVKSLGNDFILMQWLWHMIQQDTRNLPLLQHLNTHLVVANTQSILNKQQPKLPVEKQSGHKYIIWWGITEFIHYREISRKSELEVHGNWNSDNCSIWFKRNDFENLHLVSDCRFCGTNSCRCCPMYWGQSPNASCSNQEPPLSETFVVCTLLRWIAIDSSLLIGVNHYWDIVGNGIIRGPGPVAVSSKIGYLLSGPTHSSAKYNHVVSYNVLSYHRPEELN